MKKILIILLVFINGFSWGQGDTINYENEIEATNYIFSLLDTNIYGNSLLNRALGTGETVEQQLRGHYNQDMTIYNWAEVFNAVSLSYTRHNRVPSIEEFGKQIISTFEKNELNYEGLVQPFSLVINQSSYIDTNLLNNPNGFVNINGKLKPIIDENEIYNKVVLKAACLIEFYPDNGYPKGKMIYDKKMIVLGDNITLQKIEINMNDGNGYQIFDEQNNILEYDRTKDSLLANAKITYMLNDRIYTDRINFFLTTKSNFNNDNKINIWNGLANDLWDDVVTYPCVPDYLEFRIGIKYGCGNGFKIRRPIIVSPPYRPVIQPFSLNKYYKQFNISSFIDSCSQLGYDVIWVKEKPGTRSLELCGYYFAQLIKHYNSIKKQNFPDEDWETIVMGYSKGGQTARYALKYLEKEHMENNGEHPHTRLFIPFDSPHHGANIPLFAQAVYKEFKFTNLLFALPAWLSLIDEASTDMGVYTITASTALPGGGNNNGYTPHPHQNAVDYQNSIKNDFNHYYTSMYDTRKSFPAFCRNIGVSTGSYKDDYNDLWGLTPGKHLFRQSAPTYNPLLLSWGLAQRNLYASRYSTNTPKTVFKRNDWYFFIIIPYTINKTYKYVDAYEWDMAQGGYKNNFYDKVGGPVLILKSSTFGIGTKYYHKKVSFLPLVSALAINPNIWQNNNLHYNLQTNDMFIIGTDPQTGGDIVTDNYGYPHLGHPSDHFNITPFEAVYADDHTYDHIKMKKTVQEFSNPNNVTTNLTTNADLGRLRLFLLGEIESYDFYLQNFVVGENHVIDPNYEYKAWYKARGSLYIGKNVTPKTDEGDYDIKSTGNVTVYAHEAVHLKPGFHAYNGSKFHAYIVYPIGCISLDNSKVSNSLNNNSINEINTSLANSVSVSGELPRRVEIYPNPNTGQFNFVINNSRNEEPNQTNGILTVYALTGQMVHQQQITQLKTVLNLNLEKGIYLVVYKTGETTQQIKMIVN